MIPKSMEAAFERVAHPFHMWDGLMTTPEALTAVLAPDVQEQVRRAARAMADVGHVHLVGCGTSYFSAIAGTYAFHAVADMAATAHNAFEFSAYPPAALGQSALLAISHTGGTAVVLDCVRVARERGAVTIGLTDIPESVLAAAPAHVILGGGGREHSLPKTKSYPASLLRHYLLAVALAEGRGRGHGQTASLRAALAEAPAHTRQVLSDAEPLTRWLAENRRPGAQVFVLGAGPNLATALEGALKLQESAQVRAFGWELEEGMHGPWGIMEPGDLVILPVMRGPSMAKARGLAAALQHIGVTIWAITDDPDGLPGAHHVTHLPQDVPECFSPLYAALPLYQFTYFSALAEGKRPDCMRLADDRYLRARLALPR
ncbi:MAG TPA: SIS domain-containing protein [Symbiobacteriaceae bacterium]|nr:SIS domain-containing protein [Symbiobacteriaceae bacterium]